MNTLEYYENYRRLSNELTLIQGKLQFFDAEDERRELLLRMDLCLASQREILMNLENYAPVTLPCRSYFKALEEREFLFYRCIRGMTMEQTALLMCVSRDTVYRIRRRIASHEGHASNLA